MTVCGTLFDGEAFLSPHGLWSISKRHTTPYTVPGMPTAAIQYDAARLVIETGRPVAHVAAEIGVGEHLLGRWVRLARGAASAGDTAGVLDADERAELERLRRENAELRLDREF